MEKSKVEAVGGAEASCLESQRLRERLKRSIRSLTSLERSINQVGGGCRPALVNGNFQSSLTIGMQALKQLFRKRERGCSEQLELPEMKR